MFIKYIRNYSPTWNGYSSESIQQIFGSKSYTILRLFNFRPPNFSTHKTQFIWYLLLLYSHSSRFQTLKTCVYLLLILQYNIIILRIILWRQRNFLLVYFKDQLYFQYTYLYLLISYFAFLFIVLSHFISLTEILSSFKAVSDYFFCLIIIRLTSLDLAKTVQLL